MIAVEFQAVWQTISDFAGAIQGRNWDEDTIATIDLKAHDRAVELREAPEKG